MSIAIVEVSAFARAKIGCAYGGMALPVQPEAQAVPSASVWVCVVDEVLVDAKKELTDPLGLIVALSSGGPVVKVTVFVIVSPPPVATVLLTRITLLS